MGILTKMIQDREFSEIFLCQNPLSLPCGEARNHINMCITCVVGQHYLKLCPCHAIYRLVKKNIIIVVATMAV